MCRTPCAWSAATTVATDLRAVAADGQRADLQGSRLGGGATIDSSALTNCESATVISEPVFVSSEKKSSAI